MCLHNLKTVDQGQTWIRGVVQNSGRWLMTVKTRMAVRVMSWTIDTINGRTILVFIWNPFFLRTGVPNSCKKKSTYILENTSG